jgi:hypothetical protein
LADGGDGEAGGAVHRPGALVAENGTDLESGHQVCAGVGDLPALPVRNDRGVPGGAQTFDEGVASDSER